jgi:branched-chain amino acid transport system ATP-binding protein
MWPKRTDHVSEGAGPTSLEAIDLSVQYGEVTALHRLSVSLERGVALAVLGPNGAGKTSLANALSGVIRASATTLKLDGTDIRSLPAHARARLGIGHLPDSRAIFPSLSVEENLKMGFHRDRKSMRRNIDAACDLFPNLKRRTGLAAGKLSGGEQQMLALARLMIAPPRLLIVDELSHGLAPGVVANLFSSLEALKGTCTIIVVEQFVARALALADQVLVLSHGEVLHQGPAAEISTEQAAEFYSLHSPPSPSEPRASVGRTP